MNWRGTAVLALLLAIGVAAGFGASWALGDNWSGDTPAAPVPASPSLPIDPVPELLPDPRIPPLAEGLPLVRQSVGAGDFRITLPVPKGWAFFESSLNEWQWRPPEQPDFGYVLRVEQVLSNRRSIEWTLDRRLAELREDEGNVEVIDQTTDSLHISFVSANHLRHAYLRWIDPTGGDNAQVELAVIGREVDDPGMADLIARVASGIRLG
ncbi:hypothetical protein [Nocardioides pinisoli]|uniref:DUF4245 domain-containing protein n=1 Tax=Nocardioides pinisoli TaxID=2950279 RepID=A0ABT1KSP5_9ACTN|nr:hypothetical protein [Nocardioides pinisoli]MCP3420687.1 hypothetical protein [Nocardioides pinisoli]